MSFWIVSAVGLKFEILLKWTSLDLENSPMKARALIG